MLRNDVNCSEKSFLGSLELGRVLSDLAPLKCLDIGARGGPVKDLHPFAWAVEVYGFEPDKDECDRLNKFFTSHNTPFRSVQFFSTALSEHGGVRTLNVTRHRGTSSFLEPYPDIGQKFSKEDYFTIDQKVDIQTMPLDEATVKYGLEGVVYIKIDVEGLELEIFKSAPKLLSSTLLAIRSEVAFVPMRLRQPYYCDIESYLRNYNFIPMGFIELHYWRRLTKVGNFRRADGPIPYSLGQIAHGDMLFFRDPDTLRDETTDDIALLLKAAFLALTYEYVDHAFAILKRPSVKEYLKNKYDFSTERALGAASQYLASQYRKKQRRNRLNSFKSAIRSRVYRFPALAEIISRIKANENG